MYPLLHRILVLLYALLPVGAFAWALFRARKRKTPEPMISFIVTCMSGVILATAIVVIYAVLFHGRVRATEVAINWYFLVGLLSLLGLIRWSVREGALRLFRVPRGENGRALNRAGLRASLAFTLQALVLVAFCLPLVVGVLLTHRVRIHPTQTPLTIADCDYETIDFTSTDGLPLNGWWIPAQSSSESPSRDQSERTVLMCGGNMDTLARHAGILRVLVNDGYNVLAFDLRGQGESGGQWTGFGDLERHDVLGALRWVKSNRAPQSQLIFGFGFGTGGDALIAAATDESEGHDIDALAVYGAYADFHTLAQSVVADRLPTPVRSWIMHTVIPLASAHAGTDLSAFAPARLATQLWPRPILIIHAQGDALIPFTEAEDLFHAATYPKQSLWLAGDHASIYASRYGAQVLLRFFRTARPSPII